MKHTRIHTEVTAHMFSIGNDSADFFWVIAHGYAMTAEQILNKFSDLDQKNNLFCSLEALSHFYFQDGDKQVPVASWMTSRFRLDEIKDYSRYLQKVLESYGAAKKRVLFGFSQGGTTMWRFINELKPEFDYFINWAGDIPIDTDYDLPYLKGKKLIYVCGDRDQYISEERFMALQDRAGKQHLDMDFIQFEGTHKVDRQVLAQIAFELNKTQ